MSIPRPAATEYEAYYAGYVEKAENDPLEQLARQPHDIEVLAGVDDASAAEPPAAGEWSLKEILCHLCDFERVFAYRALRFARGDQTPLASFEQEPYVAASGANSRSVRELVEEFASLRRATVSLFGSFDEAMLDRGGPASGNLVTVRALVFIMAGHCEGHLEDIRRDYGNG